MKAAKEATDREVLERRAAMVHIGGSYFDDPDELEKTGRRLKTPSSLDRDVLTKAKTEEPGKYLSGLYNFLIAQVREGEELFGLYDHCRGYRIAPALYSVERLADFELETQRGAMVSVAYLAVSMTAIDPMRLSL
jgi:hypothetical protein